MHFVRVSQSNPAVGFEYEPPTRRWNRYLLVNGIRAFELGYWCGSCGFTFASLAEADVGKSPLSVPAAANTVEDQIESVVPAGDYFAVTRRAIPQLAMRGSKTDYFATERRELWDTDAATFDPGIDYYRGRSLRFGDACLFEFIIPMVARDRLDEAKLDFYSENWNRVEIGPAAAISVLDVQRPFEWWELDPTQREPEIKEHWCLSHYLLDGHHRVETASRLGAEVELVALVSVEHSVAAPDRFVLLANLLDRQSPPP